MNTAAWRYALSSVVGAGHLRQQLPCQDVSACRAFTTAEGQTVLAAVVADGAGSAPHSATGAALAATLFHDTLTTFFAAEGAIGQLDRPFIADWLTQFQHAITAEAAALAAQPRDFACTFLAAIVGEDAAVFVQVGDGVIIVAEAEEPDEYCWVFWPQRGEYENTTIFATDPAALALFDHACSTQPIAEFALLSDGLQRLALHFASQTVFAPFFRPVFKHLRLTEPGYQAATSSALATFLDSAAVNERTDDDKTLILATRLAAAPPTEAIAVPDAEPTPPPDPPAPNAAEPTITADPPTQDAEEPTTADDLIHADER